MSGAGAAQGPTIVAVDTLALEGRRGTGYPAPFDAIVGERLKRVLGDPFGLTQFGVNLVHLPPGAGSSQRHWHSNEDEFVYILEGELILATDAGETKLTAGMAAGFPAGHPDAHHLINKSESMAIYIEIGTRAAKDACEYPGIDLQYRHTGGRGVFAHKDGTPYEK